MSICLAGLSFQVTAEITPIELDTDVSLNSVMYTQETNSVAIATDENYDGQLLKSTANPLFDSIPVIEPESRIIIDPFDEVRVFESSVVVELPDTDEDQQFDFAESIAGTSITDQESKSDPNEYVTINIAALVATDELRDPQNIVFNSGISNQFVVVELAEENDSISVIQAESSDNAVGMVWLPNTEGDVYFEARVGSQEGAEYTFDVLVNERYFGAIPISEEDGWTKFRLIGESSRGREELISLVVFEFKKADGSVESSVLQIRNLFVAGYKTDSDRDGLPDKDEMIFGLNPGTDFLRDEQGNLRKDSLGRFVPDLSEDADADYDGDGLTNIIEYQGRRSNWRNPNTDAPDEFDQAGIEHCKNTNDMVDQLPADPSDCTDTDGDQIGNNTDDDDDGDGIPDSVELSAQYPFLDPLVSEDGRADFDRDGVSNSLEYAQGTSLTFDDQPPKILNVSAVTRVDATGDLTGIDFSKVTAQDGLDRREVDVWRKGIDDALDIGFVETQLAPGEYQYTWVSFDGRNSTRQRPTGNKIEMIQRFIVTPLVSFTRPDLSTMDNRAEICLELNGEPENYPVVVDLQLTQIQKVSSSLGGIPDVDGLIQSDENSSSELLVPLKDELTVSIPDGELETCSVAYNFSAFDIDNYDVEVSIKKSRNAALSNSNMRVIKDTAPLYTFSFDARQNGVKTRQFLKDQGNIEISVVAEDLVEYDWSGSDGDLIDIDASPSNEMFLIDPKTLDPGTYTVKVVVSESTESQNIKLPTIRDFTFKVLEQSDDPFLPIDLKQDSDLNGIPDELENDGKAYQLEVGGEVHMTTARGLKVTLGDDAFSFGSQSGQLGIAEFKRVYQDEIEDNVEVNSVVSFNIEGISVSGARVPIVIKLQQELDQIGQYFKLRNGRWVEFNEDSGDQYLSTKSTAGVCPGPESRSYTPGLGLGNDCLLLLITDGGPNDDDFIANRVIKDPGGVGGLLSDSEETVDDSPVPRMSGGAFGLLSLIVIGILAIRRFKLA